MTPFILLLSLISCNYFRSPELYIEKDEQKDVSPPWLKLISILLCVLGSVVLLMAFLWLSLKRGTAVGDEIYFWWSATHQLPISGLSDYMVVYPQRHYSPGYPCISNVLLGFVPRSDLMQAEVVLPFIYGLALLGFLIPWNQRERISLPWSAAAFVAINFMIFSLKWIYMMSFQMWYGEAMAIGVVASIFLAIDPDCFSVRSPLFESVALFGLGVMARLSKPPLETLVIPVVIPVLFLLNFIMNRTSGNWKTTASRLAWMALGALVGQHLWHHLLSIYHLSGHYEFPMSTYMHFSIHDGLSFETRDFFLHYKQTWMAYLICVAAALRLDGRKYLPSVVTSFLLVLSIFVLYATAFSQIPYARESASRYILHGAYGFVFYFLAKSGPGIVKAKLC
jgi:hypothetical protein